MPSTPVSLVTFSPRRTLSISRTLGFSPVLTATFESPLEMPLETPLPMLPKMASFSIGAAIPPSRSIVLPDLNINAGSGPRIRSARRDISSRRAAGFSACIRIMRGFRLIDSIHGVVFRFATCSNCVAAGPPCVHRTD